MRKIALFLVILCLLSAIAPSSTAFAFPDHSFRANLDGSQEVPPVTTNATGIATFAVNRVHTRIAFALNVFNIENAFAAHIHCGAPGVSGPIGVTLFSGSFSGNGNLAHGQIEAPNAGNACGWTDLGDVITAMQSGDTYVNVHTNPGVPSGEIRGQIH